MIIPVADAISIFKIFYFDSFKDGWYVIFGRSYVFNTNLEINSIVITEILINSLRTLTTF